MKINYLCIDNQNINIKNRNAYEVNKSMNVLGNDCTMYKFPNQKLNNKIINHGKAFRSYLKI